MNNINTVNTNKSKTIKELTAKQIYLLIVKLYKKYYTSLFNNLDVDTANSCLNQINFIIENANKEELNKINAKGLGVSIEQMINEIAIDLKYDTIDLANSLNDMILFSIYQKLTTFNMMFGIIKNQLNVLNNEQSFDLAVEIVNCRMLFNRVKLNKHLATETKTYKDYLKEKDIYNNNINSVDFPDNLNNHIECYKNKVNEKLEQRNIRYIPL